jgi:regulator of replication initiation timing
MSDNSTPKEPTLAQIKEYLASLGLNADELKNIKQKMNDNGIHGDIPSMLQKIANLEEENGQLKAKNNQLSQKTQEEMKRMVETRISDWLGRLQADNNESVLKEFKDGLGRMAEQSAEDSIVYKVACMASEAHMENVNEAERLRKENAELQQRIGGGRFASEDDRMDKKRKADVISSSEEPERKTGGLWDEMESFFKKENNIVG